MNEIISCPFCGLSIKVSCEYKIEPCDYPIRKIIEFLNEIIEEEKNKIVLKEITENICFYKAEVTTKLTDEELKRLMNTAMGYCEVCGRSDASFGLTASSKLPSLYKGSIFAGGIGPVTVSYEKNTIKAYDPVPDITVELSIVREK